MALTRTSADKFVLLAGDAASHPGVLRPLLESIPLNSSSYAGASRTKPFFELTRYIMPDPVAGRKTLEALEAFDASEHTLVDLDHDTSLRESSTVTPSPTRALGRAACKHDSAGHRHKDAAHWRFLSNFWQGV